MQDLKTRFLAVKRRLFEKVYGEKLNPEQCRAVFCARGPLLVLAGAGSGKTTVLVHRIDYLIKYGNAYADDTVPQGVGEGMVAALEELCEEGDIQAITAILPEFICDPCPPWALLAFTFTNKAAKEIRDRLEKTFSDPTVAADVWSGTFHSVCVRILHRYADRLGYRAGFSIYDTDDKKRLISLCMKELQIDEKILSPKVAASAISMAKDRLETPDSFTMEGGDVRQRNVRRIYELYQKKLMEYNAMDFDDIIMKTVQLLEQQQDVRSFYQNKFRYVLVDEYQDTNYAQFVLTKLLSDRYRNIMVVGDDDQSIYRFRGATVENILNFDKTYPDAAVVKLEQNYRSTSNILEAANALIRHNRTRHDKNLWSKRGAGDKIIVHTAENQIDEGRYIIDRIIAARRTGARRYGDFAVLYRVNEMGRSLETAFSKSAIPYRILGGQRFYDRKEIRDILAYLHVLNTPSDNLRLKRVINEPKRKIGTATVEALEAIGTTEGTSMYEIMRRAGEYTALAKSAAALRAFTDMMDALRDGENTPSALITSVFEKSGYRAMLEAQGFEGKGRIESVEELVSAAAEYEKRTTEAQDTPTLSGFLEEITLVSDVDTYDAEADAVVMMTVHSAKGLEFPVVFLAGMEDGIFPSAQNLGMPDEMSEERRLAYVAITRAKEKLYVTCARERILYGRTTQNPLSLFIREEVPADLREDDAPRRIPARAPWGTSPVFPARQQKQQETLSCAFSRPVNLSAAPHRTAASAGKSGAGAADYGIEKFAPGTRVRHELFGVGTILTARDMGGDVLYEVNFESAGVKKLMATFAHLKKEI